MIIVFSDNEELQGELAAKARSLGDAKVATASSMGLPDDQPDTIAAGLAKTAADATLVLVGATKRGKDVGPRLAALLDWPYAGDIQSIESDDGWTISRMVLSGNSLAKYKMGRTAVATATPGTFEADGTTLEEVGPVEGVEPSKVKVTGTKGDESSDFDLSSAEYVVGVGRGFKAKDDLQIAQDLASALNGAVGCSRPVAADLKWLGEEHWIGLSGHEIKPKIYFAAGVSGQIQHVAGIRGSKLIVAINTNKDAPIFQVADYSIVGDLYKVLPALTKKLKA